MREDDGFAGYVEAHGRHLVQVGYLLCGDLSVAREVVRAALARACLSWRRLSELPELDGYLLRVVVTARPMRRELADGPLAGLPSVQRAAVVLRCWEGLTGGQLAAVMDVPQDTASQLLQAGLAALRPVDEPALRASLLARSEEVPDDDLLPGVRARSGRLRRLRLGGVVAVGVLVVVVVAGVADLALTSPQDTASADLNPADLPGHTWYLASATTAAGAIVRPAGGVEPTLVFTSKTSAETTGPGVTRWLFRLDKGRAVGVFSGAVATPLTADEATVDAAVSAVLDGTSAWRIVGTTLTFSDGEASLTYSRDPSAAQHG